ncbi:hypothetical protein D3C72_1721250 [compost metagenome]
MRVQPVIGAGGQRGQQFVLVVGAAQHKQRRVGGAAQRAERRHGGSGRQGAIDADQSEGVVVHGCHQAGTVREDAPD